MYPRCMNLVLRWINALTWFIGNHFPHPPFGWESFTSKERNKFHYCCHYISGKTGCSYSIYGNIRITYQWYTSTTITIVISTQWFHSPLDPKSLFRHQFLHTSLRCAMFFSIFYALSIPLSWYLLHLGIYVMCKIMTKKL